MGALQFNGTSDHVKWTTLAAALQNIPAGAYTLAWLMKRNSTGTFDALGYLLSSTGNGVAEIGASITSVNELLDDNAAGARTNGSNFNSTASPYLFVLSKAAGTATARLGWKLGSGGAWTHVDFNNTDGNHTAATMLEMGAWEATGDFLDGWLGVFAAWSGAMSDVNKEALDDNWRTSDLSNSAHGTPVCLIEFNVAGASLVDLIGNATALTATGTTLAAAETLNSWNFDGTGAAPPSTAVLMGAGSM